MQMKDPIKDFLIKKLLTPKVVRIDIPGYVISKFYTLEGQNVLVRNLFMPENFFVVLERILEAELGQEGLSKAYAASKMFGYNVAYLNMLSKKDPALSIDLFTRFIEVFYASGVHSKVDIKTKYSEIIVKDPFITRLNGNGVSLSVGALGGIVAFIFNDFKNIECGTYRVSANEYTFTIAPYKDLDNAHIKHFRFSGDPPIIDSKIYAQFNKPDNKSPPFNASTLQKFLQNNIFSYSNGSLILTDAQVRFTFVEASLLYLLEEQLGHELLYRAAKEAFTSSAKQIVTPLNPYTFVADILTAVGAGIVSVDKKGSSTIFNFEGFPWYYGCEKSKLPILKGVVEGLLVGQHAEKREVISIKSRLSENKFLVSVEV